MKFSVLLPTHNRLEYLRYAVESVRRQDDPGWELVISDNDSTDDIARYVSGLDDSRVRYVRTDRFVPVTDNWNNALRHSTGNYMIMLGDDDALLPGTLSALRTVIKRFDDPGAVYVGALLFAYPGVLPDAPRGYLQPNSHAPFFAGAHEPFVLDARQASELVHAALDFRARYDFNMQYVVVSRETVTALSDGGDFFRSPFPDYYAMNLVFARTPRIVVDPRPRVVVGITKSSHGFFHFNRRDAEARALLNTDQVEPDVRRDLADVILPGTNINTSWLLAMESLHRRLGCSDDMRPNYTRYRRLQAVACAQAYYMHRAISRADMRAAEAGLTPIERWTTRLAGPPAGVLLRRAPQSMRDVCGGMLDRMLAQFGRGVAPEREVGRYRNILEVFEARQPEEPAAATVT